MDSQLSFLKRSQFRGEELEVLSNVTGKQVVEYYANSLTWRSALVLEVSWVLCRPLLVRREVCL
jgi:hypothetical protein